MRHRRAELADLREAAHHRFDRGREHVHAAHVHHVVRAREDAAFEARERAAAAAPLGTAHDEIGGAIPNDGTGRAPEIRHDQLAHLTIGDRLTGGGIDHLAQVFRFVEVQKSRVLPALEADRPDLGQPVMVDHPRAPALLDALPRRGDAAARLARDNHHAHAAVGQRTRAPFVTPSAAATPPLPPPPPPAAAHTSACSTRPSASPNRSSPAATDSTCRRPARSARRSDSRPRTRSRSRETDRTRTGRRCDRRRHARGAEHGFPAVEHPLPALVGIDPLERTAGRRRGVTVARVPLDRLGQRRAPRRVRFLIRDQLRLRRQRQPREVFGPAQRREPRQRDARAIELARVERISAVDVDQELTEPLRLPRAQRVAIGRFKRRRRLTQFHTRAPAS